MPIHHRIELQALECTGCGELTPIRRGADPEEFTSLRELVTLEHAECDQYRDAHKARMARRFRKKMLRLLRHTERKNPGVRGLRG